MDLNLILLIVNTLLPDELQEMIERVKAESEEKYINKRSLNMKVLPEFQKIFIEAKEVSSRLNILWLYKDIMAGSTNLWEIQKNEEFPYTKETPSMKIWKKSNKISAERTCSLRTWKEKSKNLRISVLKMTKNQRSCLVFLTEELFMRMVMLLTRKKITICRR